MRQLNLFSRGRIKAKISTGNHKLGRKIPNISLRPIVDCANCKLCAKKCYAMKAYRQYPQVKAAWGHNGKLAKSSKRNEWFADILNYIDKKKPGYFRWHVAGDIIDQDYYEWMCDIAIENPQTKFLAFTKNTNIKFLHRPKNLAIVISMWPGLPKPNNKMPLAWFQDGTETRVPKSAILCPGSCDECKICWNLPRIKKDVVFNKH